MTVEMCGYRSANGGGKYEKRAIRTARVGRRPSSVLDYGDDCDPHVAAMNAATTRPARSGGMPVERANGGARVAFAFRDGATRLADLYQRDPCRVLFPTPAPGDPPEAAILTTSGGLADGDRIVLDIAVGAGATATVTTSAAEKIYRAALDSREVGIDVTLDVGAAATLEWLPQETIVFDAARLARKTVVDLAPDARLLACESLALGRSASGERFTRGFVLDSWRLRRGGKPVWADALRLDGPPPPAPGFGDANALATVLLVLPTLDDSLRDTARAVLEPFEDAVRCGVSCVSGVLIARLLGDSTGVRRALVRLLVEMRHRAFGLPSRLPRVWHT